MSIPDWIDDNVTDEAVKKKLKTLPQKRKYVTQAAHFNFANLAIATVFASCCVSLFNLYFVFFLPFSWPLPKKRNQFVTMMARRVVTCYSHSCSGHGAEGATGPNVASIKCSETCFGLLGVSVVDWRVAG